MGTPATRDTTVGSFRAKLGTCLPPRAASNTGGSQEPRCKTEDRRNRPRRKRANGMQKTKCREDSDVITTAITVDSFSTSLTSRECLPRPRVALYYPLDYYGGP